MSKLNGKRDIIKEIRENLAKLHRRLTEELPKEVKKYSKKCKEISDLTGELDENLKQQQQSTGGGSS